METPNKLLVFAHTLILETKKMILIELSVPLTISHTENIYIYVGTHNVTLAVEARSAWGYTVGRKLFSSIM